MSRFTDGLTNVLSSLINRRAASSANVVETKRLDDSTMRHIYRSGVGSKIVRLKSSFALTGTLEFDTESDGDLYAAKLAQHVKLAARYMLAFGRGIIVVHKRGDDLSKPLSGSMDPDLVKLNVFSGDMVSVGDVSLDLQSPRYYKPLHYNVRGHYIHWTRVIDFTYVEPTEFESSFYRYGGISEYELVYEQLINDGVVERASSAIVEKNSTIFYKVKGFKEALRTKRDAEVLKYFGKLEDARSIYGAGLLDEEDSVESVSQNLTNLSECNDTSLRRLSLVTGIPVSVLVGESVRGLNSSGDNELTVFQQTIENLQDDYLVGPINRLMHMLGRNQIHFSENQGQTPKERIDYETKVIVNARALWEIGEDYHQYLEDRDILKKDDWEAMWGEEPELTATQTLQSLTGENPNG